MRQTCLNCGTDSEGDTCPICHKYDDSDYVMDDSKSPRVIALETELAEARAEIERLNADYAAFSDKSKAVCIDYEGQIEALKTELREISDSCSESSLEISWCKCCASRKWCKAGTALVDALSAAERGE